MNVILHSSHNLSKDIHLVSDLDILDFVSAVWSLLLAHDREQNFPEPKFPSCCLLHLKQLSIINPQLLLC